MAKIKNHPDEDASSNESEYNNSSSSKLILNVQSDKILKAHYWCTSNHFVIAQSRE